LTTIFKMTWFTSTVAVHATTVAEVGLNLRDELVVVARFVGVHFPTRTRTRFAAAVNRLPSKMGGKPAATRMATG